MSWSETEKLKIAELTSEESRQFLTDEAVVLIPMGSMEDQGTHAPMGDYLGAECVALDMVRAAVASASPPSSRPPFPSAGRITSDRPMAASPCRKPRLSPFWMTCSAA